MEKIILSGHDVTGMSYREIELVFIDDNRSLCENKSSNECDCTICPTKEICDWLCSKKGMSKKELCFL